jgi:hypothetical protein
MIMIMIMICPIAQAVPRLAKAVLDISQYVVQYISSTSRSTVFCVVLDVWCFACVLDCTATCLLE